MISIVIPVYDEEDNIELLCDKLVSVLECIGRDFEIIAVDDGSADKTFERMLTARNKDDRIKLIKFRKNFGQSAALKAGFDHAEGEIVISIDSDLQNDPEDIPRLLEKMENNDYDVVCGWRASRKDTLSKKIFSRIANRLRKTITGEHIHDSGCTLRVYKNECVKTLELYGETHRYIPAMLLWKGYKIGEVKVNWHSRMSGSSKFGFWRIPKSLIDVLVVKFLLTYSKKPMFFFGPVGGAVVFTGFLMDIYIGWLWIFHHTQRRPIFIFSLVLIVIGLFIFMVGFLAEMIVSYQNRLDELKKAVAKGNKEH